jgi:hypothetical protein
MDFIKKHYEKVILSLVLLGVVGALVALPFVIQADKDRVTDITQIVVGHPKPLDPLDLSRQTAVLDRLQSAYDLDFDTTNKLFNPVLWKKNPVSGEVFKVTTGHEIDAEAAVVSNITPLYLILSLQNVETNGDVRYVIGVERQTALTRAARYRQTRYAAVGEKIKDVTPAFTVTGIKGDPASPDELDLQLADTGETAVVTSTKPFHRADAYTADLKYDPEKKTFPARRVGAQLFFGGDTYIIVAINENEVILSAQSNQKKTILHYTR